jgi:hypothetical protein
MPAPRPDCTTEHREFPLVPVDYNRLLEPGTISMILELDGSDPTETLMTAMPSDFYFATRDDLERLVREEIGVSLAVILTQDDRESAA